MILMNTKSTLKIGRLLVFQSKHWSILLLKFINYSIFLFCLVAAARKRGELHTDLTAIVTLSRGCEALQQKVDDYYRQVRSAIFTSCFFIVWYIHIHVLFSLSINLFPHSPIYSVIDLFIYFFTYFMYPFMYLLI